MSCTFAEEVDLMAFAADRNADEWTAFRDHYPRCAECSRRVAALGALESLVADRDEHATAHLDEDRMLDLAEGRLGDDERRSAELHLEGCASCRTELAVLRTFELGDAADSGVTPITAARRKSATTSDDGSSREPRERARLLRLPVATYVVAAAAALLALAYWSITLEPPGRRTSPEIATNTPPVVAPEAPAPDAPGSELAGAAPPETPPAGEEQAAPETRLADASETRRPAPDARLEVPRTPPSAAATSPDSDARDEALVAEQPAAPTAGEEFLIAALLPSEMPDYAASTLFGSGALDAVRIGGALRSAAPSTARLSVLAPEHVGATRSASPRLYFALDRASDRPVEVLVNDPRQRDPLLARRFEAPLAAGLHVVDLAAQGVALQTGVDYEWSVSLIVSEDRREADVVSLAAIRRVPEVGERAEHEGEPAREVHRLAAAGYWYDAFDVLTQWLAREPGIERLREYRRALLEQVGLESVGAWLDAEGGGPAASS